MYRGLHTIYCVYSQSVTLPLFTEGYIMSIVSIHRVLHCFYVQRATYYLLCLFTERYIASIHRGLPNVYCIYSQSVPSFTWYTSNEEVADLTSAVRSKTVTSTIKQSTVITAVPQKQIQQKKDQGPTTSTNAPREYMSTRSSFGSVLIRMTITTQ